MGAGFSEGGPILLIGRYAARVDILNRVGLLREFMTSDCFFLLSYRCRGASIKEGRRRAAFTVLARQKSVKRFLVIQS